MSCRAWTIARMNEPNASDPRWYLKHLQTLLDTGLSTNLLFLSLGSLGEKYQMAAALPMTNWFIAWKKALIHRRPKTQ